MLDRGRPQSVIYDRPVSAHKRTTLLLAVESGGKGSSVIPREDKIDIRDEIKYSR